MAGPETPKFDVKSLMSTVRKVIDPEYGVPIDEETHPINYRIARLTKLVSEVAEAQRQLGLELDKVETNLKALLEEINQGAGDKGKAESSKADDSAKKSAKAKGDDAQSEPKEEPPKEEAEKDADSEGGEDSDKK